MLCGENVDYDPKYPLKYRRQIHHVMTLEFKQTILRACDNRDDEWSGKVKARLLDVIDLVAAEARYHGDCYKEFCKVKASGKNVGRPQSADSLEQFNLLCNYLENNNECQFSIKELRDIIIDISGADINYTDHYLKSKLCDYFQDRLVVHNVSGRKSVLCMSHTSHIVLDLWYKNREKTDEEERKRIVRTAAQIVREDIQKMKYDCEQYPNEEDIRSGSDHLIPETLKLFTSTVSKKKDLKTRALTFVENVLLSTMQ